MTKASKVISVIILLALIIPLTSLTMPENAFSAALFTNGGFETGDFTGWDVTISPGGNASVVKQFGSGDDTYLPKEGSYFALLRPGQRDVYTVVSQSFTVPAGVISGWAFFKAGDYMPFDDEGMVEITIHSGGQPGGQLLATVFQSRVSEVGNYGGTPWTYWSYMFASGGEYTIQAKITNILDSNLPSYLGIDDVSLQAAAPYKPKAPSRAAAPTPALILTKNLGINPEEVYSGQPITISANMANDGDNPGGYTADLKINGQREQLKLGDVDGHSSVPVIFTLSRSQPGTYTVDIGGQKGSFTPHLAQLEPAPLSPLSSSALWFFVPQVS
jgi:hypothetical protein